MSDVPCFNLAAVPIIIEFYGHAGYVCCCRYVVCGKWDTISHKHGTFTVQNMFYDNSFAALFASW
jgi:hypothetical protein